MSHKLANRKEILDKMKLWSWFARDAWAQCPAHKDAILDVDDEALDDWLADHAQCVGIQPMFEMGAKR